VMAERGRERVCMLPEEFSNGCEKNPLNYCSTCALEKSLSRSLFLAYPSWRWCPRLAKIEKGQNATLKKPSFPLCVCY
jgi:hypothetical protein